jgi:hypothetical protein
LFNVRQATIRPNVPINFDRHAQIAVISVLGLMLVTTYEERLGKA